MEACIYFFNIFVTSTNATGRTGVLGLVGPLDHVVLGPSVREDDGGAPDPQPGALLGGEAGLEHVAQGQARHGAPPHVLHAGHRLLHVPGAGVPAQRELGGHLGGVLQQAHARPIPGHVQGVHHRVDKALDQLEVDGPQALGAVDDEDQVHDTGPALCLCRGGQGVSGIGTAQGPSGISSFRRK